MKKGSNIQEYTYLKRRAIELKEEGMKQVEIVRVLGVGTTTLSTWLKRYKLEGVRYLEPAKLGGGKKPFLKKEEEEKLSKILVEKTAEDYGFTGGFWTYERIGLVISKEFGVTYKKRSIGDLLKRMKFSWQKPKKKSYHQKEEKVKEWKEERLPRLKEKAVLENRTIVYIDESAFSYCPYVCKTYSPKGVRPVLKHGFLRGGVQVISAVSPSGKLYYELKSSSLKGADVAKFLEKLLYHFRSKNLLVIWDGAKQHSSDEVKKLLKARGQKRIHLEILPPYSPQLNVDEQAHGFIKKNLLANRLFYKIKDLRNAVIEGYDYLKNNDWIVHNFFFQKDTGFYT